MRMGIMGGTLDPVHSGHLEIAQAVRKACSLDGVLLLPAGDPPHKKHRTDKWLRLAMAKLAAQSCPGMTVSDIEVQREGTTYTVDTLLELTRRNPQTEWVYIIGADTVRVLDSWKCFEKVAGMCSFAAVGRPGCPAEEMQADAQRLRETYGVRIDLTDVTGPDISSTDVRRCMAEGRSIEALTPPEVARYIRDHGLYLCAMTWEEIEQSLRERLKPGRMLHTLGVADTAIRLAVRHGADPMRARLAGMLHDCAKSMEYGEMVGLVRRFVPDADAEELTMEPVLHAPAGMVVAEQTFGVRDPDILAAIRNHTLGRAGMSVLEKIVYLADFIEPTRKPFDGLQQVRDLSRTDLNGAVAMAAKLSNEYVISRGGTLNSRTRQMLDELSE